MNLDGLNKAQKAAVLSTNGPVMILAGAGSGKTKTLVTKISYLIEEKKMSPFRVLALTFSNKAAREMRERIASEVECDVGALQITTFHAFCAKVLRSEATYLGLSRSFTIYDTSESKSVAKGILGRRGISTREISPFEILYYIDELKNNGYYLGRDMTDSDFEIDESEDFFEYYKEYESEVFRSNAVDFGGLITGVIQLFEKFPDVLERYQDRFQYLLIDEYQDTNRAQFELLTMLGKKHKNICVVGDEDQSIYSWRGADIRNILDFEEVFPDVVVHKLEQNYRSSKMIIEAASHVIARNSMRKGKDMWTENPEGESIEIIEVHNDKKEAEYVAEKIATLNRENIKYKDMAVFYRTNSQSRLIEDGLRKLNISYRVVGGVKFYERKEVKDLLAYLRLIVNGKDSLALSRVINVPARGIGATTLRKLEGEAIRMNVSLWEAIDNIVDNLEEYKSLKMSAKVRSSLRMFTSLINELKVLSNEKVDPSTIFDKALHESGYWEFLKGSKDYEAQARLENLQELGTAIKQYETTTSEATLIGFLETITLDTTTKESAGEHDKEQGEVSLMTVHGSKGLEFSYVFLVGAEENVFPSYKSLDAGEIGIEEERRLFYVAMTRAMEKLYILFAQGRMLFGQLKFNGYSRFIQEIPSKYYDWKKIGVSGNRSSDEWGQDNDFDEFSQENTYEDDEVVYQRATPKVIMEQSKFPKGIKIAHALYGEGNVLNSEGIGQDEKVLVKFKDGTKKRFMVKFSPLTAL